MVSENRRQSAEIEDRRSGFRYPSNLELEFRLLHGLDVLRSGKGRMLNCSETGLWFQSDDTFSAGQDIEVSLRWPFSSNLADILVEISGQTIRTERNCCAVKILRHTFKCQRT